jgi:hypothetical protein
MKCQPQQNFLSLKEINNFVAISLHFTYHHNSMFKIKVILDANIKIFTLFLAILSIQPKKYW